MAPLVFAISRRILLCAGALTFVLCATPGSAFAQDFSANPHAWTAESYARRNAARMVMPTYPQEALRQGISGLVRTKIEINEDGEVLRIRLDPIANNVFRESVVESVKQWTFKPFFGKNSLPIITRVTFSFKINDGKASVKLYDPSPNSPAFARLDYLDSKKELIEWKEWFEAWTSDKALP